MTTQEFIQAARVGDLAELIRLREAGYKFEDVYADDYAAFVWASDNGHWHVHQWLREWEETEAYRKAREECVVVQDDCAFCEQPLLVQKPNLRMMPVIITKASCGHLFHREHLDSLMAFGDVSPTCPACGLVIYDQCMELTIPNNTSYERSTNAIRAICRR